MLETTLPGSGFLNSPEEHFPWFGHPWQPVAKPAWAEVGPTQATHYHDSSCLIHAFAFGISVLFIFYIFLIRILRNNTLFILTADFSFASICSFDYRYFFFKIGNYYEYMYKTKRIRVNNMKTQIMKW